MIHIDEHRLTLCGEMGDPIHHPTPAIAAAMLAQHPEKRGEFCEACFAVLRRDYCSEWVEAKNFAASLK